MTKHAQKRIAKMNKDLARINREFDVWYNKDGDPTWEAQCKWLTNALYDAGYLFTATPTDFWKAFNALTNLEDGYTDAWNNWQWKYIKILISILVQVDEKELHISI